MTQQQMRLWGAVALITGIFLQAVGLPQLASTDGGMGSFQVLWAVFSIVNACTQALTTFGVGLIVGSIIVGALKATPGTDDRP